MIEGEDPKPLLITYRQRISARYILSILVDLMVLNLFAEFWDKVTIVSFSTSILAVILLYAMLRVTLIFEHKMGGYFKLKPGKGMKVLRIISTWAVLFGSKFLILGVIDYIFGDRILFGGIIPFIAIVIALLLSEYLVFKFLSMKWMQTHSE